MKKIPSAYTLTVEKVIHVMWNRLEDSTLTLAQLSKIALFSPFHFDRVFRSVTRIPPRQFLSAVRLQQAKEFLRTTRLPVTDIAQIVGYNSLGTFTTRFTKLIGVPPNTFRGYMQEPLEELKEICRSTPVPRLLNATGVSGEVRVPDGFEGFICVGLFPKPIPMGPPASCTIVFEAGPFWIPPAPDGEYFVMSVAFSWDDSLEEYLVPKRALRGMSQEPVHIHNGAVDALPLIELRPARFYDPPILVSLPQLIQGFINNALSLKNAAN